MSKFYVTTPIYYANAEPHIGSAYPTIAADVLARFYRNAGVSTFFLAGTAEHGTKISESAKKAQRDPQSFVDEMSAKFSFAWNTLAIAPDDFIRTTEKRHEQGVIAFFEKLKESGKIYEGEYEGVYCVGHEAFLKATELGPDGLCPDHQTRPEKIKEKNWFFRLSEYQDFLLQEIEGGKFVIEPPTRKNEIVSFIKQGLEDISISRQNVSWAIPLPWDRAQTIYVWIDELFNYCSALDYPRGEKYKQFWPADLHIVGKDIIKFHCIIWPALLRAAGLPLPKKVFAHGFFTINGQKISKSLGNAIDPVELAQKFGSDALRYFLLREIPFGQDGDFSLDKLAARYEADLANGLGNLFSRVTQLVAANLDGSLPDLVQSPRQFDEVQRLTADLKFHEALAKIWESVAWANKYIDENKLWEAAQKNPRLFAEVISSLVALLQEIAKQLAPYLPETSEKMRSVLSAKKIIKPEPLFPRLEIKN